MQENRIQARDKILLTLAGSLYAALICAYALTRLYSYKDSLLDDGIIDQVFWNVLHKNGLFFTVNPPYTSIHYFGLHFTPINLLLLPFYALWPNLALFQIAQSLCFAVAGIVLFNALKAAGAKTYEAWLGTVLYWLNPYVVAASIWDFHEIAFAQVFLACAFWALFAKRFPLFLYSLGLLLCVKEHYGLSVAGFGFLWGWRHGEWKRASLIILAGIAAFVLVMGYVIPAFRGGAHMMLRHETVTFLDRYGWLSDPWSEKIPFFFGHLLVPDLLYVFVMLMAGLFFPLAAPFYLAPATADLLANTFASSDFMRDMTSYHSAAIIMVMIAAGYQGKRFCEQRLRHNPYVMGTFAICTAFAVFGLSALPIMGWELEPLKLHPDSVPITAINRLLPEGALCVQNNVGMFFSKRKEIYPFPYGIEKSSAVVFYLSNPYISKDIRASYLPFNEEPAQYRLDVLTLLADTEWHIAYWQAPWLVLERGTAATDERNTHNAILQSLDTMTAP